MPEFKFFELGKNRRYRKEIDPKNIMNNKHFRNYQVVDIYPLDIEVHLDQEAAIPAGGKPAQEDKPLTVRYLYDNSRQANKLFNIPSPMKFYEQLCQSYDLEPSNALRIFTDNPITCVDSVSNVFVDNKISDILNQASENEAIRTGQELSYLVPTIKLDPDSGVSKLIATEPGSGGEILKMGLQDIGAVLLRGMKVAFPKIWKNTTYSPSLNVTISLSSAYGHPESIEYRIIRPLVHLLLMASPVTYDGVSYFNPFFHTVRIYGIADYPVAFIRSMSIAKSSSEIPNNKFRQPLKVDVTLTIEPLFSGFAAISSLRTPLTKIDDIVKPSNQSSVSDFGSGMILVDNILNSFKPAPLELQKNVYPKLKGCGEGNAATLNLLNINIEDLVKNNVKNILDEIPIIP